MRCHVKVSLKASLLAALLLNGVCAVAGHADWKQDWEKSVVAGEKLF
jgi:hypothetical protein